MPTRYTVTATEHAEDRLTILWLKAPVSDHPALAAASNALDRELREDAGDKGIALPMLGPEWRFLEREPLRVYYVVSEPDRLVCIRDYERTVPKP